MDKLKINLIPPELQELAKKEAKRSRINSFSIALLGLLIVVTIGILSVVVIQSMSVNTLSAQLQTEESKINNFKDKEAVVRLLKNRIDTIAGFTDNKYQQGEVFDLITGLFPQGVAMSSIQIGNGAKVSVSGNTESTAFLQTLFNNLTDPNSNKGKITSVNVISLSQAPSGRIIFDLDVILNGGEK